MQVYLLQRGGAGNIKHEMDGSKAERRDDEIVPETNLREGGGDYANYHTGRGGQGNVHKDKFGGHSTKKEQEEAEDAEKKGLGEKVKKALRMEK